MIRLQNLDPQNQTELALFGEKGVLSTVAERLIEQSDFDKVEEVTISGHRKLVDAQKERLKWTEDDAEKKCTEFRGSLIYYFAY